VRQLPVFANFTLPEVVQQSRAARDNRLSLISKLHPDANLFEPLPPYSGKGRPRVKGPPLPKPRQTVKDGRRQRLSVGWYGGGRRRVQSVTGTGCCYKASHGLVLLRWVFVQDQSGTHRDAYFFTTDPALAPKRSSATTPLLGISKPR
jgi:hypothetical protein